MSKASEKVGKEPAETIGIKIGDYSFVAKAIKGGFYFGIISNGLEGAVRDALKRYSSKIEEILE